jgi:chemosensory pili system protein ChpA (sensor histidine kinase/response regulator)
MEISLRQIEQLLNNFFNTPTAYAALGEIDPLLRKIVSVLSVLGAEDAMRAAEHTHDVIAQYRTALEAAGGKSDALAFPNVVTQNITALGFFVEALHQHPQSAKTRFAFDSTQGILLANLLDKGVLRSEALTSADPSFDPLLDLENNAALKSKPLPIPRPAPKIQPTDPLPESDEAIDAELLDIFMSEAEEVLAFVSHTLPSARLQASDQDQLSTLRRSFHTLKGSGRMVGLNAFAETAYSVEQVMNVWLAEAKSGTPDLFALLDKAVDELSAWVADLRQHGRSGKTPVPLSNAAHRVKSGQAFHYEEASDADKKTPPSSEPEPALPAATPTLSQQDLSGTPPLTAEAGTDADTGFSPYSAEAAAPGQTVTQQTETPDSTPTNIIEFPLATLSETLPPENIKRIGRLEVSPQLFSIYIAETDVLLRTLSQDFSEWQHEPDRPASGRAIHAAHSLSGSSATVGLSSIQDLAHTLEKYLHTQAQHPMKLTQTEFDVFQLCVDRFKQMLQAASLGEFPAEQTDLVQILRHLQQSLTANPCTPEEHIIRTESRPPEHFADVGETETHAQPAASPAPGTLPEHPAADPTSIFLTDAAQTATDAPDNADDDPLDAELTLTDRLDDDLLPVFLEEGRDILPSIGESLRTWQQNPADNSAVHDILRQLHTVKGSARMAGAMTLGEQFHLMETQIEQILNAGPVSAGMLEDLMARHDYNLQLFEHLLNPEQAPPTPHIVQPAPLSQPPAKEKDAPQSATTQPPETTTSPAVDALGASPEALSAKALPETPAAATQAPASPAPVARVRVRADVLDRLVNQAGEVSIARSKIENEVDTLKLSLSDLTENLSRLRGQLREVEIQAESQIASRAQAADREFDPLEFDRFSRLQELTRMMTESVDDVAAVQESLARTVTGAVSDLETQAQLTRSLQQDLMQVRMVPFSSIAERLYQIARQTSKEMNKAVNLDIRGTSVEVDRGVLERMTGPLEHLLRNAIVHGIESREERKLAEKNETGQLLVEIRQEGNEVAIQLSDDGKGLDFVRIRERALASGLVPNDRELTTTELENVIFQPGFSTASEVTTLAGRGVGLDVVRAEAAALGGRVNVHSDAGKGTRFTVHLPLTLAVTSVVLVQTAGITYAVPSVLVEQVQHQTLTALTAAYNEGFISWQGARVPLFFLSALLGDTQAAPAAQQYTPVMILRSGSDRVAIHVDEVVGNREVVVKNIGPQLARMIGIVGATVLGSGSIVLILDPVALGMRAAHENLTSGRATSTLPQPVAQPTEIATASLPSHPTAETSPAGEENTHQGLRKKNVVMVVDDSLTVRRVTQRFLQREGYQVVLAKDGVDALEKLQEVKPDVMLVDIEMPRMDGFDLIRNVRSDSRVAKTPIIMITSRTASKHRNYAMELGANEYYGKPFQEQQLLESIEEYVGKSSSQEPAATS